MALLLALALGACGGGHGYRDAPAIRLPPGTSLAPDAPPVEQRAPLTRDDAPSADAPPARDLPPEVAQGRGPRGTSGEVQEDGVGYAVAMAEPPQGRFAQVAIGVAHPSLPAGTLVELTALETGRTIVAMVVAREDGAVVALSPGAAQALGVGDRAGVRVRTVVASPQDQTALRSGQAASPRLDAPPALLAALRRKLPGEHAAPRTSISTRAPSAPSRPSPIRSVPVRSRPVPVAPRGGFMVQVAALSSAERAQALARQLGGRVVPLGKFYRVQLGPFTDRASAQRARDGAARRGYGDARIFPID